jgi:hypothetical protein
MEKGEQISKSAKVTHTIKYSCMKGVADSHWPMYKLVTELDVLDIELDKIKQLANFDRIIYVNEGYTVGK